MQKYWLTGSRLRKSFIRDFENDSRNYEGFACYKKHNGFLKNLSKESRNVLRSKESRMASFTKENVKIINRKFTLKKPLADKSGFHKKLKMPSSVTPEKNLQQLKVFQENIIKKDTHQFSTSVNNQPSAKNNITFNSASSSEDILTINGLVKNNEGQSFLEDNLKNILPVHDSNHAMVPKSSQAKKLVSILKVKTDLTSSNNRTASITESKSEENSLCVITKVVGNAKDVFSETKIDQENSEDTQPITLKKTNDITKIKGWRRKQFFVEKPTTVEFFSIPKGSSILRKSIAEEGMDIGFTEKTIQRSTMVKNAFVCDSLDEFLNEAADLKIDYEIPHLYAEYGIKLTSEDIVSRPNLSEKELKEVETRYCISLPYTTVTVDDEKTAKRLKRHPERVEEVKASKVLKLDPNRRHSLRFVEKQKNKTEARGPLLSITNNKKTLKVVQKPKSSISNIKLASKLIGLAVYPGPFSPLHPVVQSHLKKIRSRQTTIDRHWANFAASAVLANDKNYKRCILPVRCLVKIESNSKTETLDEDKVDINKKIDLEDSAIAEKDSEEERHSVIELLDLTEELEALDNSNNPDECQSTKSDSKKFECQSENSDELIETKTSEQVDDSSRASFDKKVAYLLAKKVRLLKYNKETPTSIDRLKTLTPNTVEFIKLNFVKESFLTGYINLWYLSAENLSKRSRAFVSFSQTPPVPNAINLKSSSFSFNSLPKIITEVVSEDKMFDANEYAILHCDGNNWEIHGSLNIAFQNNVKKVEQIFASVELPELKNLQEIAYKILRVKAVKWWVLDLTQQFRLISIKFGNLSTVISRKKFFKALSLNSSGFVPLKKDWENRVIGAYIIRRLMPFVLIGPYYLLETHNMILKSDLSTVPFMYYGVENVTANYPLKFFINSVIKSLEKNNKSLEGLWLYDKMCLDSTTYLEVVTTNVESSFVKKYSSINIEHGYSLNSLTNSSPGPTSEIVKRVPEIDVSKEVTVYMYFNIFELGFVEGKLQCDDYVVINYPLDYRTRMKSQKIGNWFLSLIKRRIEFIPKNLEVSCFITKYKEDLKGRVSFDKFCLGGAHVLTKHGLHNLLELTDSKIESLGLYKNDIMEVEESSRVIREVKALSNLCDLLKTKKATDLSVLEIIKKAIIEIKNLERLQKYLSDQKVAAQKKQRKLFGYFMEEVNFIKAPFRYKIKMIKKVKQFFKKENNKLKFKRSDIKKFR